MRKTPVLLWLVLSLISPTLHAQNNAIERYFSKYLENPAFDRYQVTEETFDQVTEFETDDASEQRVLDAIGNIEGILVLMNEKTAIATEYYYEVARQLNADEDYEDLLVVEHEDGNVHLLIREEEDEIQEFVMAVAGDESFVLASIYGKIDLGIIRQLGEVMSDNGKKWFEHFENVDGEIIIVEPSTPAESASPPTTTVTQLNDLQLNIFPNPATEYLSITAASGKTATVNAAFYSLSGKEIQNRGAVTLPFTLQIDDLPDGAYFLRLTNEKGVFKNFKIVKQK